jgi:hypothetical protein
MVWTVYGHLSAGRREFTLWHAFSTAGYADPNDFRDFVVR